MNKKSCVYLLGDSEKENTFKIGVTKGDLEKRIKKLQTGNSGKIYVIDYFETEHPFFVENQLHLKYFGKKILNEWFELGINDITNFKQNCLEIEKMIETLKDNPFFPKNLH